MTTCATCGSHLSRDYLRVCGDNDDVVSDCPHCEATRRAEARRSAGDASDTEDEQDSEKLVLTVETGADGRDADGSARRSDRRGRDRGGGSGRSGVVAAADDGWQDGGRGAGSRGVDRGRGDGEAGSQPSILSSVFDAIR